MDDDDSKYGSLLAAPQALIEKLTDNLDTPGAMALIDESFAKLEHTPLDRIQRTALVRFLETIDDLFGLELMASTPDINDDVKHLLINRQRARDDKDWLRSDELRAELEQYHITVKDTPSGQIWSRF